MSLALDDASDGELSALARNGSQQAYRILTQRHRASVYRLARVAMGDSDEAFALFTFDSLAAYEKYRQDSAVDPDCIEAFRFARTTGCIRRYERRFLSPLFAGE